MLKKIFCVQGVKRNILKLFQMVSCTKSHLSWKFHENPFTRFSVMLLKDKQTHKPTEMKTLPSPFGEGKNCAVDSCLSIVKSQLISACRRGSRNHLPHTSFRDQSAIQEIWAILVICRNSSLPHQHTDKNLTAVIFTHFGAIQKLIILCPRTAPYPNSISGSPWWRHQMETFSALPAICAGNSPVAGEFPAQRPVTRSFDVFFDLHLNKR